MAIENIYQIFKNKNFENGTAQIITPGRQFIEAGVYAGVIVNIRSQTLSCEQIFDCLISGAGNQVSVSDGEVRPEDVQPGTVENLFHSSAPFSLNADDVRPQRLLQMIRLMELLTRSDNGFAAFDIMAGEILKRYKRFAMEGPVIKKRIDDFSNEFLIALPSLNSRPMPSDSHAIPGWIFNSVVVPDSLFKDILLYFIFFGEMFRPVFRTIVKKESGFGAKVGFARISKTVYNAASNGSAAIIFKGAAEMGALNINWHSENRTGVMIAPADLEKLGIKDGDTVSLVFTDR